MEKEIIDKSNISPRFKALEESIDKWVDEYAESEEKGINLVIVGVDHQYEHAIKFALGSKADPIESIIQSFNSGLGKLNDTLEKDIFNGMCEYLGRLFAQYPGLYERFKNNVEILTERYHKYIEQK